MRCEVLHSNLGAMTHPPWGVNHHPHPCPDAINVHVAGYGDDKKYGLPVLGCSGFVEKPFSVGGFTEVPRI